MCAISCRRAKFFNRTPSLPDVLGLRVCRLPSSSHLVSGLRTYLFARDKWEGFQFEGPARRAFRPRAGSPDCWRGGRLYDFLTGQGRIGQRFAPRFWERDATIGRERELMIVACKKWHVARRLLDKISFHSNVPALEYIFDEDGPNLPDLGGIEESLGKRARHRRALMRMLFDYFETDRMIVCLDPANLDLVKDFYEDRSTTRLLEIECTMSDAYLVGHARRVGLAGEATPEETLARLLPTIRNDVILESDRLRDERFPGYYRMRERADPQENAAALAGFLALNPETARDIAATPHLFAD